MPLGSGIPLTSSFDVFSNIPLDARTKVASISERNAIPATSRYVGLEVTVENDGEGNQKKYWLIGGIADANWSEFSSGGGAGSGVINVADYAAMFSYPEGDREIGLIFHVLDVNENFQLQKGIDDENFVDITNTRVIVADATERLAYPAFARREGLEFYQLDTAQTWVLSGGIADTDFVDKGARRVAEVTLVSNTDTLDITGLDSIYVTTTASFYSLSTTWPFDGSDIVAGRRITVMKIAGEEGLIIPVSGVNPPIFGLPMTLGDFESVTYEYSGVKWFIASKSN